MKDILALYDKRAISKIVLLFYIARTTSLLKTLELNCNNSILLKDEINV